MLAGLLGYVSLNFSESSIFPMLTGLFGLPLLITSTSKNISIPEKLSETIEKQNKNNVITSVIIGGLAGIVAGLLPGIGSTQSTIITQQIFKTKNNSRNFLMSIGSVTTSDYVYSLLALFLIGNPRSGIAVAVGRILEVDFENMMIFIVVMLVVSSIATILTLKLSSSFLKIIRKVNYRKLSVSIIVLLFVMMFLFSEVFGILTALVALVIGYIPNKTGVNRAHAMGCLVMPTILFFMGLA